MLHSKLLFTCNYSIQVSLHQIQHELNVTNDAPLPGYVDYIFKSHKVVMTHVLHDDDLAKDPLHINLCIKSIKALIQILLTTSSIKYSFFIAHYALV